jgi:hypothetical protein
MTQWKKDDKKRKDEQVRSLDDKIEAENKNNSS